MAWYRASGTPTGVDTGKKAITSTSVLEGFMGWVNGKKVIGTKKDVDVYYLGEGTSFDIKTLVPSVDSTKLTANNFVVEPISIYGNGRNDVRGKGADGYWNWSLSANMSKTYSNGVLACSLTGKTDYSHGGNDYKELSGSANASIPKFKAYLVVGYIYNK